MSVIRYTHNAFSVGIISASVQGNNDFEGYNNALEICDNYIIQPTGGVFKRSGTVYISRVKDSSHSHYKGARLFVFSYDLDNQYILECGQDGNDQGYIRFYTKYGRLMTTDNPPKQVEIQTDLTVDDFNKAKTFQDGNQLVFITPKGMFNLKRTDPLHFFLEKVGFTSPPMGFINSQPIVLKVDKAESTKDNPCTITVRSKEGEEMPDLDLSPFFFPTDVGNEIILWDTEIGDSGETIRKRYYLKIVAVEEDEEMLTFNKVKAYLEPEKSYQEETQLPFSEAYNQFQVGAFTFSEDRGYPKAATIFEGRLFLANSKFYPVGIWGSGNIFRDWTDFYEGADDTDAVAFNMRSGKASELIWLVGQSKLFIGTQWGVFIMGSATYYDEPISPRNFDAPRLLNAIGVSALQPLVAHDVVFFTDNSEQGVYEIALRGDNGLYEVNKLSTISADLFKSKITRHTYAQTPFKTYWCAMENGTLGCLTYQKENGILGWSRHILSGDNVKVEDICTMKGTTSDLIWMIVRREDPLKKGFVRYIEYLDSPFDPLTQDEFKQYYVDCGVKKELCNRIIRIERGENLSIAVATLNGQATFRDFPQHYHVKDKMYSFIIEGSQTIYFSKSYYAIDQNNPFRLWKRVYYRPSLTEKRVLEEKYKISTSGNNDFHTGAKLYIRTTKVLPEIDEAGRLYVTAQNISYIRTGDEVVFSGFTSVATKDEAYSKYSDDKVCWRDQRYNKNIDYIKDNMVFIAYKAPGDKIYFYYKEDWPPQPGKRISRVRVKINKPAGYNINKSVFNYEIYKEIGTVHRKRDGVPGKLYHAEAPTTWLPKYEQGWYKIYINKVPGMVEINDKDYFIWGTSGVTENNETSHVMYAEEELQLPNGPYHPLLDMESYSQYDQVSQTSGNAYLYFDEIDHLEHLVGKAVHINIDGNGDASTRVVGEDATIKIIGQAKYMAIGLPITAELKTTSFSGGCITGSSVGTVGSQRGMWLYLYASLGGQYGTDKNNLSDIQYTNALGQLDRPKDLVTGLVSCPVVDSRNVYERSIYIRHNEPVSFNILSITQDIEVSDGNLNQYG